MGGLSWEARIDKIWEAADAAAPAATLERMADVIGERPLGDPDGLYEWASAHDFLGKERQAVRLYRAALERGLPNPWRLQATLRLARMLHDLGQRDDALELLDRQSTEPVDGIAAQAFVDLALRDCEVGDDTFRAALRRLGASACRV